MNLFKGVALLTLFFFSITFIGCAGLNPYEIESDHGKAAFANKIYTSAFHDYNRIAKLEGLKPEVLTMLKAKRLILVELKDPMYGPVTLINQKVELGEYITDSFYVGLLDKLLELEAGWYTYQTKNITDNELMAMAIESDLAPVYDKDSAVKSTAIWPVLLELLKIGIHAFRAMMSQRGLNEEEMEQEWIKSKEIYDSLNVNDLVVL